MSGDFSSQGLQQHVEGARIRLGLPTWESATLRGTLYDHRSPIDQFLSCFAAQFDGVELSQTFTDLPSETQIRRLRKLAEASNENFRFCPWIPRRVSHEFPLGDNHHDMREFLETVEALGQQLGPIILKLPETFSPESWPSILRFARRCPKDKRFSVHLTHMDWYRRGDCLWALSAALAQTPMNILIEDDLRLKVPFEDLITGDHVVIRFRGTTRPELDRERLGLWTQRLGAHKERGIKDSYFFLYEEEEMCLEVLRRMALSLGGNTRVPETFNESADQISFDFPARNCKIGKKKDVS